jgi:hypothetical protein
MGSCGVCQADCYCGRRIVDQYDDNQSQQNIEIDNTIHLLISTIYLWACLINGSTLSSYALEVIIKSYYLTSSFMI